MAEPAARLAAAAGWPLLAEPTSGVRCGPHDRSHVVAHYDVLLRAGRFADDHSPGLLLRVGDMPTSKPLRAWAARAPQVVLDPHGAWHEPTRRAELLLRSAAAPALDALAAAVELRGPAADPDWLDGWRAADAVASASLAEAPDDFEPKLLAALEPELPDGAIVWLSSSMPVRDVEAWFPQSPKRLRFLANRGANGIDGVVSSAAGAALASGSPGLAADRRAGAAARRRRAAGRAPRRSRPAGRLPQQRRRRDLRLPARRRARRPRAPTRSTSPRRWPSTWATLAPEVREIRTDRATNVELHRQAVERVERAL